MAKRIIQSPGVEIQERDLSLRVPAPAGTAVYTTGFADQGPTDEVIGVSSLTEFERIYGTPRTPAERYFYHTVKSILNSQANLYVNRLPYGAGTGNGFGSSISVLAYPVTATTGSTVVLPVLSALTLDLNFGEAARAAALNGAAFQLQLSGGRFVTVNFAVNGDAPSRGTDALAANPSTTDTFTVPINTSTTATIQAISDLISTYVATSASTLLEVRQNGAELVFEIPDNLQSSFTGAVSSSVVPGLDDPNDVFTITAAQTSTTLPGSELRLSNTLDIEEGTYFLGAPTQFNITQDEYIRLTNGQLFNWASTGSSSFANISALKNAGLIVINKGMTIIDGRFTGYYLGLADNTNINPASAYDAIRTTYTVTQSAGSSGLTSFVPIPADRLDFALTATPAYGPNPVVDSVSQVMEEKITGYDISDTSFDDTLNVGLFKLRQTVFGTDANTLGYLLEEGYNGSIGYDRQINSEKGGQPVNFFIENVENNSRNVEVLVNPYVSGQFRGLRLNDDGTSKVKVRLVTKQLEAALADGTVTAERAGCTSALFTAIKSQLNYADALFPFGAYGETKLKEKIVGNIPGKLTRALDRIRNSEVFDLDIIAEGGLGTIWTYVNTVDDPDNAYFDDTKTTAAIEALRTSNTLTSNTAARDAYTTIFNKFSTFVGPIKDGGRGDMIYVADVLRQILVTGKDNKVINDINRNFSVDIYWALRHQFEFANTSYACVYANYGKLYDEYSGLYVYVPTSGAIAAKMVSTDSLVGPWGAPAGFNRGILTDYVDIAFVPNQRQRDDLYTVNLNPITSFPDQGIVIFGQKTMLKKPSAFDRINVRRNFLYLEKATKAVMKFFVFENNTLFTRTQVVNTLSPFFERVKTEDGLYDYLIVCDERNNTGEVIDNNELVVDIYLKPVRTAEFIRVNFYATRTDANFDELVGG